MDPAMDVSSSQSPSPASYHRYDHSPSPTSPLSSPASDYHTQPESSTDDEDDAEGVFLGPHDPQEAQLIARLSASTPPSRLSSRSKRPRHSIRKRDSTEILRRRSVLHSAVTNGASTPHEGSLTPKVYPGGFYEKGTRGPREEAHYSSDEDHSTPRRPHILPENLSPTHSSSTPGCSHSDLTFDFSNFRLTGLSPSRRTSQRHPNRFDRPLEDLSDDEGYEDSDKENVAESSFHLFREVSFVGQENGQMTSAVESVQDMDHEDVSDEDHSPLSLDMGGLRLSDFSDPDSPTRELANAVTGVLDPFTSDEGRINLSAEGIVGTDPSSVLEVEPGLDDITCSPSSMNSPDEMWQRSNNSKSTPTTPNSVAYDERSPSASVDTPLFKSIPPASDVGTPIVSYRPLDQDVNQTDEESNSTYLPDSIAIQCEDSAVTAVTAVTVVSARDSSDEDVFSMPHTVDHCELLLQSPQNESHATQPVQIDSGGTALMDNRETASDNGVDSDRETYASPEVLASGVETESGLGAGCVPVDSGTIASTDTSVSGDIEDGSGQPAELDEYQTMPAKQEQVILDTLSLVPVSIGSSGSVEDVSDSFDRLSSDDGPTLKDVTDIVIVASAEAPDIGMPNATDAKVDVPPCSGAKPLDPAQPAISSSSVSFDPSGDADSDIGSPLPQARGGFVVIPTLPSHLAFSMRAENGSPCKSLPVVPAPQIELKAISDSAVQLSAILGSPGSKDTLGIPRRLAPSSGDDVRSPRGLDQSSTAQPDRALGIKNDSAKLSSSSHPPTSIDRPKPPVQTIQQEQQAAARAVTIRNQLDTAFVGRFGRPQKMLLRSTSSSASSAVRKPISRTMPMSQSREAEVPRSRLTVSSSSNSSTASSSCRVGTGPVKAPTPPLTISTSRLPTTVKASRAPLAPRNPPLASAGPRQPLALGKPSNVRPAINIPRPMTSASLTKVPSSTAHQPNPLKRSLNTAPGSIVGRSTVSVGYAAPIARPTLGLPSRTVRPVDPPALASTGGFAMGTCSAVACYEPRSPLRNAPKRLPGTPSATRNLGTPLRLGTPSRNGRLGTPSKNPNGTPSRPRTALMAHTLNSSSASSDPHVVEAPQVAPLPCPDTAATKERGSSEDHDAVSLQLPRDSSQPTSSPLHSERPLRNGTTPSASPSPVKTTISQPASRPRRSIKPPEKVVKPPPKVNKAPAPSSVPGMSEKELKAITQLHTSRNEVYHCAIDRQIVRKTGPRPPSPTSKIRTTADRDEEEKKAGRGDRAKRRSKGSDTETTGMPPVIERVTYTKGPGDDEDWKTPSRPSKKAKTNHDKTVNWDRELLVIRDDGRADTESIPTHRARILKSALRREGQAKLDANGNLVEGSRPKESLKRQKIVVTAIFYDGEEPVPAPAAPTGNATASAKGKKK